MKTMRLNDHEAEIIKRRRKAKRQRREREIALAAFRAGWEARASDYGSRGDSLAHALSTYLDRDPP